MTEINKDLQNERKKCTFNIEELTEFVYGGPEKTQERIERGKSLLVYFVCFVEYVYIISYL